MSMSRSQARPSRSMIPDPCLSGSGSRRGAARGGSAAGGRLGGPESGTAAGRMAAGQSGGDGGAHFRDPFQRLGPCVADVGPEILTFGAQADVGLRLGSRGVAHGPQRMREVQQFAAMRVADPGGGQDLGALVIDEKEPLVMAAVGDPSLEMVVKIIDVA